MNKIGVIKTTTQKSTITNKSGKRPVDFSSFSPSSVVDLCDEVTVVTVVIGPGLCAEVGMLINARSLLIMHIWKIYD